MPKVQLEIAYEDGGYRVRNPETAAERPLTQEELDSMGSFFTNLGEVAKAEDGAWVSFFVSAKSARKPAAGPRVLADRTMRAGRVFKKTYLGRSFTATIVPGGRVRLEGDGIAEPQTFANLHRATQAAIELAAGQKKSANAFAFWRETEPAAKPKGKKAASPPKPEPTTAAEGQS